MARRRAATINAARNAPVLEQVLYESYHGQGALCNPLAIFRELLDDPRFATLRHVWSLRAGEERDAFVARYGDHPRVSVVDTGGDAYWTALHRSRFLVNNSTFPAAFTKREGQTYLNTWHGTPLKRMVYDTPEGATIAGNIVRNALAADYLLSPNEHTTRFMYGSGFRLDGLYDGTILETGYPRIDATTTMPAADVRAGLAARGLELGDGPLVLFAPTWRGSDLHAPEYVVDEFHEIVGAIRSQLEGTGATVLLKVHQFVYATLRRDAQLARVLVPNDTPTNDLLAAVDLLVTDFSSIFFDFLPTRRPIVFYAPDADEYRARRGTYVELDALPGPVVTELAAAVKAVADGLADGDPQHAEQRRTWRQTYCAREDGGATRRVVDHVFAGVPVDPSHVVRFARTKQRLVFYPGSLLRNGITSSFASLLSHLDYDRCDVTVVVARNADATRLAPIDPRARVMVQVGEIALDPRDVVVRDRLRSRGDRASSATVEAYHRIAAQDAVRWFGDARFDVAVDFSGYSPIWADLIAQTPAGRHVIWLHNDLRADARRTVDGRRPHEKNLGGVFRMYESFDALVSVSEQLRDLNRRSLAEFAPAERFTAVHNLIDHESIRARARVRALTLPDDLSRAGDALDALLARYGDAVVDEELRTRRAIDACFAGSRPERTFVFAGRLSPEKGLPLLVDAFAIVARSWPDARLVILGDGPERGALERRVRSRGVRDQVRFAGMQTNAPALMARAGCMTMSSVYEGQPMVLLEAQALGLAVVASRFATVDSALVEGNGLVTERTPEALAAGLVAFLEGRVAPSTFSADDYTRACLTEFASAVGL